jgi:hypothetical protein
MAYLANSTFENGKAGWRPINNAGQVTWDAVVDGTARSGARFLRVETQIPNGSVGYDFQIAPPQPINNPPLLEGSVTQSIGAIAYIRAAPGRGFVSGKMKLWALGLEGQPVNNNATAFTVDSTWTMIACALDSTGLQGPANRQYHPGIRLEFYLDTIDTPFDIDTVMVM